MIDYTVKSAICVDRYVNLCAGQDSVFEESKQDEVQEMIDEGQLIAMKILFDIREWDIAKSLAKLDTLLKNCHEANYKYFFLVNFKYAKLLFK